MTAPTARELLDRLDDLVDRARRLPPPSYRRPEAFHEARSELADEIRRTTTELRRILGLR